MTIPPARVHPQFMALDGSRASLPSLPCLHGATIFVAGFSELRQLTSWLHLALGCPPPSLVKEDACMLARLRERPNSILPHDYRKLASCREELFSRSPWTSQCPNGTSLHFEWKSFMWSERDRLFRERVAAAAVTSQRVIVILGGGPHHFARFADHEQPLHFTVDDSFAWPQRWLDDYVAGTSQLLDFFSPRGLPPAVCVLWRLSNIGPRHAALGPHHPSARNGLHDWLNRFTVGCAFDRHSPDPSPDSNPNVALTLGGSCAPRRPRYPRHDRRHPRPPSAAPDDRTAKEEAEARRSSRRHEEEGVTRQRRRRRW